MNHGDELLAPFERLATALGIAGQSDLVRTLADRSGWGTRPSDEPYRPCGFRPGVPWGLSVVVGAGAPELRVLVEAHEPVRVTELFAEHGATPVDPPSPFPIARTWHSVAFAPGARTFRIYLCPPPDRRPRFAGEEVTIHAHDLVAQGRRKVYALVPDATVARLEELSALGAETQPGDATRFAHAMLGGARPIWWLVCFVYTGETLRRVALHFGVPRHVPDEADVAPRLEGLFAELDVDPAPYRRSVEALGAPRHHFVSFQRIGREPRVTVYFLPDGAGRR